MTTRATFAAMLSLGFVLTTACKKDKETTEPTAGENLLGAQATDEDDLDADEGGGGDDGSSDENYVGGDEFEEGEEAGEGEEVAKASDLPKLPPRAEPVEKCKGKGAKRTCKQVDPKPAVSAAYGVRTLMGEFRWGMAPDQVLKLLSRGIEAEYAERQKKASGPMDQDTNRKWRQDQLQALKANHVQLTSAAKHKWGVSVVQAEFADDNNEELVWVKSSPTLRKYYFFKDGALWKIFYAYSPDTWPGKGYEDVIEEKFKKWFGVSPKEKSKQDPNSKVPPMQYLEWNAQGGENVRAFNMTDVHGVIALTVVDGSAEKQIGERLPNMSKDEKFSDDVSDVLGGTDVCYNSGGEVVKCDDPSGYVK